MSTKWKVKVRTAELPQASTAVHVKISVRSLAQSPGSVSRLNTSSTLSSQLSVTVGGTIPGKELQSNVCSLSWPEITGAVVSFTVITCSQEVLLPQASTAIQVRTKLYGQSPADGPSVKFTSTALHASVAVAIPVTSGATPAAQSTVMAAGQSITGAVVSITVTVCTTEAAFPQLSTAVKVREMIRSQLLPDSVTLTVTSTVSSQLSMAVAISVGMAAVHSMVVSAGTEVKIGASSSVIVRV